MRVALRPRTDHQQRTGRIRCKPARGDQRNGGRAPRRDRRPVEHQQPGSAGRVEHDDVALDGRPPGPRIGGCERDELGDREPAVQRRHDEQAAAAGQWLHEARRDLHRRIAQQQLDRIGQAIERQAIGGGGSV
jgi:hypothetical protein